MKNHPHSTNFQFNLTSISFVRWQNSGGSTLVNRHNLQKVENFTEHVGTFFRSKSLKKIKKPSLLFHFPKKVPEKHINTGLKRLCFITPYVLFYRALQFLYPYGATLNVMKPGISILSSGSVSFPLNRPVCALFNSKVSI